MHGSIGASAAVAEWDDDGRLTVWTAMQAPFPMRDALAQVLSMPAEDVRVIHVEGPGCYGHNGSEDVCLDAALLARTVPGRPVLVQWSREDEHVWEPYGPAMLMLVEASLGPDGSLLDWNYDVRGTTHLSRAIVDGEDTGFMSAWSLERPVPRQVPKPMLYPHGGMHRNADPLYSIPRRRVVKHFIEAMPIRTSSLRGLGAYANVFAVESFIDDLAEAAGRDPLEFRLAHLDDERAREVLTVAADRAGWHDRRIEFGHGLGIGFARYKNAATYTAVIVEATVDDATSAIALQRIVVAADAGQVIDPDGLVNQLEGGAVQSASWTLKEHVRFDRRRILSVDWESYPILTFPEIPQIETVILDRPGLPSLGAGEATQGPTVGAIANAVKAATGLRLRKIPFTPEAVRAAAMSAG
jgi:CO/xanthine dehydrogenase Mo-binding subunit